MGGSDRRPLIAAGVLLGIGLGGFLDGVLFHQLLQTHSMLSAKVPKVSVVNMEVNMFWDGLFHAFTWLTTVLGLWLFWHAARRGPGTLSCRTMSGSLLLGWGLFNLVEGVIDHYLLQVHHVVERLGLSRWDAVFVLSGVLLGAAGWALIRSDGPRHRLATDVLRG